MSLSTITQRFFVISQFWYFLIPGLLLILLLAKNPFSDRNLIANFEPFPDSFHYITTARCWLTGQGWGICREGRSIPPAVPPFYGVALLPFLSVSSDPRIFYVANVVFTLCSFVLLVLIFHDLGISKWIQLLSLLLYVTSFVVYWFPSLAMAENLLTTFVLLGVWLLTQKKLSFPTIILAGLITSVVYGIKYSALGLTASFFILFSWKIFSQTNNKLRLKQWLIFVTTALSCFFLIDAGKIFNMLIPIVQMWIWPETISPNKDVAESGWWLSPAFFLKNLSFYLRGVFGETVAVLWEQKMFVPRSLAVLTLLLLIPSTIKNKRKFFFIACSTLILLPIVPLSFFYAPNFRYLLYIIPLFLILVAYTIHTFLQIEVAAKFKLVAVTVFLIISGLTLFQRIQPVKYQVLLNVKYAETPWWYIATRETDQYFSHTFSNNSQPILITSIPPHLYDFYSSGNIQLLPLSLDHDFRENREELFGEYDYSNLILLYQQFLDEGREVYVTNYGLGNEKQRQDDFAEIQNEFKLELIQTGCHELCNLWKLTARSIPQALSPKK